MSKLDERLQVIQRLPCSLRELANALAEEHAGLVMHVAHKVKSKLPANVELDDLVSAGYEGLLQAALSFDPARGIKFHTYAVTRIRGAMLDQLRKRDQTSRLARRKASELAAATTAIAHALGRGPSEEEIQQRLGWTEQEIELASRVIFEQSLEEPWYENDQGDPTPVGATIADKRPRLTRVERDQWFARVTRGLFFEEQVLLWLYNIRGRTMKEIGNILDLSESRVSQLHSRLSEQLARQLDRAEAWATRPKAG
jgi:RNA polymerase sigma factor FliA